MKKFSMLKLLAILAIASVFTGCGCKDVIHYYLPQDFKDCFVFPEGSWWVYTVNANVYDTLTLISANLYPPIEPDKGDCEVTENFISNYSSKRFGNIEINQGFDIFPTNQIGDGDTIYHTISLYEWYNEKYYIGGFYSNGIYAPIYFGSGLFGLKSTNQMEITEQQKKGGGYWLETITDTIIKQKITKVLIFRSINITKNDIDFIKYIDSLPPFRTYYVRGIGLIKKEMYNGDVWELENYFINH